LKISFQDVFKIFQKVSQQK